MPRTTLQATKNNSTMCAKDTTTALTISPALKDACISTLSISVALTSCCLPKYKDILNALSKKHKAYTNTKESGIKIRTFIVQETQNAG